MPMKYRFVYGYTNRDKSYSDTLKGIKEDAKKYLLDQMGERRIVTIEQYKDLHYEPILIMYNTYMPKKKKRTVITHKYNAKWAWAYRHR